jgi:hypothetical protein
VTRRIISAWCLAALLAGFGAQGAAQGAATTEGSCTPRASRAAAPCEQTTTVVLETETTFSLELPAPRTLQCAATMEIEYTQRDTLASVAGTIDHEDCAASSGEHRLTVTVRGENGELTRLEFVQPWQRDDDRPVTFEADYTIPANSELLSVRPRQLRCTCADASDVAPPGAP